MKEGAATRVEVTKQTLRQAPNKAYTLDLTRQGKVYTLAAGVDYNKIRVRTSKGDMPLSDWVRKPAHGDKVVVGLVNDMRNLKLKLGPGTIARYTCEGLLCQCAGDRDCNQMFREGVCGDIASCNNDNGTCQCLKKM